MMQRHPIVHRRQWPQALFALAVGGLAVCGMFSVAIGDAQAPPPATLPASALSPVVPPTRLPQPPRVWLDTAYKSPGGKTVRVHAGGDLQGALNATQPGDIIELEAGARFSGNFTLPLKANPTNRWIVLRGADARSLPSEGARVVPQKHAAQMPKIISPSSAPALNAARGAHHFRMVGIELGFAPSVTMSYNIISLGEGDETSLEQLPHDLIVDRCFVHGTTLSHSKRGVQLNGARLAVIDSHIGEIHGIGQDTQAVMGWNGPGPFKIINNFLEAPGENVIFGGSDPAIPNLVPSDIEIRGNHFFKPLRWKESIVPKPNGVTARGVAGGNLKPGTTLWYRVAALGKAGDDVDAVSTASDEVQITLAPGQTAVELSWQAVVYGDAGDRRSPLQYVIYSSTQPPAMTARNWVNHSMIAPLSTAPNAAAFCSFTDVGAAGSKGLPPDVGRRWSVKNLFELKSAQRVLVAGNVFENNWGDAQTGNAILFTVRNQDGAAPWSIVQDVAFTNNIVRHSAAAFQLLGVDYNHPSAQTRRILIRNNLIEDIDGARWDGNGMFLGLSGGLIDLVIDHNTILHGGNITSVSEGAQNPGFVFTNNLMAHNEYGMHGQARGSGNDALGAYFPDFVVRGNVVAGANANTYPAGNFYPPSLDEAKFINRARSNYRLSPGSPFKNKATDSKDIGADIGAIEAATRGALSGLWPAPKRK